MEKIKRTAICVYVDPEVLERLKQICKHEEKSQGKFLSRMIMNYQIDTDKDEPVINQPMMMLKALTQPKSPIKPIVTNKTTPVKNDEPKKFNLAEALAQTKGQ